MSVINQVLKDLDKRQQGEPGVRVRSHYQSGTQSVWGWVGALVMAIVLSALLTWWLMAYAWAPSTPEAGSEATMPDVLVLPTNPPEPEPAEIAVERSATEVSAEVRDNEPEQAMALPNEASTQQALEPELTTHTAPAREQHEPSSVKEVAQVEVATQVAAEAEPVTAPVNEPQDRGEMQVQRVERSASELATQRLEQAINALESGQGRKAETLLEEALVLQPAFIDARQQLAAYYYGRGFSGEALRVLRDGLAHSPSNVRLLTLSARIYEETGRADDALGMLNRVPTVLPEHNDIVVLRAALANELGQYGSAAEDYRELLAINPNQGIWWLGLALAEEGQGDFIAARLAYQRAIEDSRLDKASRDFARNRVEALAAW